jgi:tartrate-resistant acid phosphatase type 5
MRRIPALLLASLAASCGHVDEVVDEVSDVYDGSDVKADGAGPDGVTRFVALGDTGRGNPSQYAVSRAIKSVCQEKGGCTFALLLGDNFYPTGVSDIDDEQFDEKFEKPYADLPFPFRPVLGNHDYGYYGTLLGVDEDKGGFEVAYSKKSDKWDMPADHYRFRRGPVDFVAINTNALMLKYGSFDAQVANIPKWLSKAKAPWRLVFGHHTWVSNGPHGNAGSYGAAAGSIFDSGDFFDGSVLQRVLDTDVCGHADVYLSGHDHNLQDMGDHCGVQVLVSGAGACDKDASGDHPCSGFPGKNSSKFQSAEPGFILFEATAKSLTFRYYNAAGAELHARTVTKK